MTLVGMTTRLKREQKRTQKVIGQMQKMEIVILYGYQGMPIELLTMLPKPVIKLLDIVMEKEQEK